LQADVYYGGCGNFYIFRIVAAEMEKVREIPGKITYVGDDKYNGGATNKGVTLAGGIAIVLLLSLGMWKKIRK